MVYIFSLSLFILAGGAASSAFLQSPHNLITKPCHGILNPNNNIILYALEEKKDRLDGGSSNNLDTFISSLPSPEDLKENILEGTVGERGEQYVLAQFGMLFLIAIGGLPFLGDTFIHTTGLLIILSGLVIVYKTAADLDINLTPWPVPVQRGTLVTDGIFQYMRHPMYAGLLFGMVGLSIFTDSVIRLLLTAVLYFILDAKSDFEEAKLIETYQEDYKEYKQKVMGKFFPNNVNDLLKP